MEYGFAYGSTGDKLSKKTFKIVTTAGAPEEAYHTDGSMQTTINEILKPFQTMALFTQMIFTPTFTVYGALEITDEELAKKAQEYKKILVKNN